MIYKQDNIFLVGPMGAGKTTLGRQIARALDRPFYDSDLLIEERTGVDVAWIFDVEGEEGFRQREEAIIDEMTQEQGIVLATGGGAILSANNRKRLAARGLVIYLETTYNQQLARMEKDTRRPLLRGSDRAEVLKQLNAERAPLYAEIADCSFPTQSTSIKTVVAKILSMLKKDD